MAKKAGKAKFKKAIITAVVAFGVIAVLFVLYVASLFGINFRVTKTAELKAMQKAASVVKLSSGYQTDRDQNDLYYALGKPIYPEVRLTYSPLPDYTSEDVFSEIVGVLEENNWEKDRPEYEHGYYHAALPQKRFILLASVRTIPEKNVVRIWFSTKFHPSPTTPAPKLNIYNLQTD
jgi:hypothetical protein